MIPSLRNHQAEIIIARQGRFAVFDENVMDMQPAASIACHIVEFVIFAPAER